MIATLVMSNEGPMIRIPTAALAELRLHTGQRVRVELQGLPSIPHTPVLEPDGTPA